MIRLHDHLTSGNGYKVRLLLHWLDIPFDWVDYDIDRAETRTPEFLEMNPNGRIPLLEIRDDSGVRYLAESNAIVCYLAEGTAYLPSDPWARAQVMQWLFFEQYSHEPNIASVRFWITHGIEIDAAKEAMLPAKRAAGDAALQVMEGHLQDRPWFVGESLSVADIALFAYTHVAPEGGFDLTPHPAIGRWIDRVTAHPLFRPITWRPGGAD